MTKPGARRPPVRVIATLLAVVLAGCGGGGSDDGGAAEAGATASPAGGLPRDRVAAGRRDAARDSSLPGSHRAKLTVSGSANPDATILFSGGCDFEGCDSVARAGSDGRWSGKVWVLASADDPTAVVEASFSTSVEPLDEVEVRLRAAARQRAGGGRRAGEGRSPSRGGHRRPSPSPSPSPSRPRPRAAPELAPQTGGGGGGTLRRMVLVGDSLGEGIEPLLPPLLPGWQFQADALQSRPLATGMGIVAGLDFSEPTALAISLFTNDDPRNVDALAAAVRTSVQRVSPGGCAIWATIVRPPVGGVSYQAANARWPSLKGALGNRLQVVPWAEQVGQHPEWVASDGVHATPAGYRARAQMYAQAAKQCG